MKKYFILLFALISSLYSFAYKPKDFDKLIDKLDVWDFVRESQGNHPAYFWVALMKNDPKLNQFSKDREKGKETALNALQAISEGQLASAEYIYSLHKVPEAKTYCDSLSAWIGLSDLKDFNISIFYDDDPNAFCTPQGQIFVTDSLIFLQDFDMDRVLGICAHETAHFILEHSLIRAYETEKRLKKNKITGAIVAGINAAAQGYAQAQGAYTPEQAAKGWNSVNETTISLFNAAYKDAYGKFQYAYSRDQEIQADIVAVRFLQWNGYSGREYIDALMLLGTDGDKYYDSKSDHPKMDFRIALLDYLLTDYVPKEQRISKKSNINNDDIYN